MASHRDDFSAEAKNKLCERVGGACSNPECRAATKGPHSDPTKAVSVGVAAHIRAAAPGGPRYDASQTPEQRRSIENGIWLCHTCASRIDKDSARYQVKLLVTWKEIAEDDADGRVGKAVPPAPPVPPVAPIDTRATFLREARRVHERASELNRRIWTNEHPRRYSRVRLADATWDIAMKDGLPALLAEPQVSLAWSYASHWLIEAKGLLEAGFDTGDPYAAHQFRAELREAVPQLTMALARVIQEVERKAA